MVLWQVDYTAPGCFYCMTAYDLESDDSDDAKYLIARDHNCDPEEIYIYEDSWLCYPA